MKRLICIALIGILLIALSGCVTPTPRVTVPDVIGYDIDDARSEVESEDLVPYPIKGNEAPEASLERIVYLQDPAALRRVPKDSGVELTYYTTIPSPPVEARVWTILGTCLPGCESMMADLGLTSSYGNRYWWPDYDELERLGLKAFINIRTDDDSEMTEALVRDRVLEWKDRPVCGGWWSDQLGHEPDICNQPLEKRIWFYETIRKYDPDGVRDRPVMEMMNCTSFYDFPDSPFDGWENAFSEETHDLLMMDLYAIAPTDEDMAREIERLFRKFIVPYNKTKQLIPQINAYIYRPGSIWCAYNAWSRLLSSEEYDNPYRGEPFGLAYYCDLSIRENGDMQREIREVNEKILGGE